MKEPTFEEIVAARRESAAHSIHPIATAELEKLMEKLFADDPTHPWQAPFNSFVNEHAASSAYTGQTSDGYGFVYYPRENKGIWFRYRGRLQGVGIIAEKGLAALGKILAGKG